MFGGSWIGRLFGRDETGSGSASGPVPSRLMPELEPIRRQPIDVTPVRKPVPPRVSPGRQPASIPRAQRLEQHPPSEHASRLLAWIQTTVDLSTGSIHYVGMRELYADMLGELGWFPQPWVVVAREFDIITTGGEKPYEWVTLENGRRQKLRVYPIPTTAARAVPMRQVA